ncbi:xanthine dehydrogenase family protein molybdopterin-binding subunit [Spirochaeta isovalerica]|uniref:CO/xanthine dehydrogenase Mo-binding subunit n=1 Tax=Spirochaeta isovalerica TaxID=150 RepID=A0A841R5X7_9SPIO|nr:molybdopterin cofactor-binding domain-containing protein [Spirochaeta isovalerica]MBB6480604.1 CO/xanthine dehydrogenase Mo-binding subunit [Spirochaeta isovalerica]
MIETKRLKEKLAGKIRFPEDISTKRTLIGAVLRSPVDHGEIREIKIPEVPEDITVITASDIPGSNRISVPGGAMPLLARKEVTYRGEAVLLAAGPDRESLDRFLESVEIDLNPLPEWKYSDEDEEMSGPARMIVKGDPVEALEQASIKVESSFTTPLQRHLATPLLSVYVKTEGQKFTISSSTQWPTNVIQNCAAVTGVARKNFSIKLNPLGKPLDSKIWMPSLVAAQAALLAQKSKKPVSLSYSAEETILCSPMRIPARFHCEAGLDESGKLQSLIVDFKIDTGSHVMLTPEILDRICIGAAGVYQCRHIKVTGIAYRSHKPPLGAFSGMGLAQAFFAVESLTDILINRFIEFQKKEIERLVEEAVSAGDDNRLKSARTRTTTDPAQWRSRNFLIKGNTYLSGGKLMKSPPLDSVLEKLIDSSDFTRKYAAFTNALSKREKNGGSPFARKGIGLATSYMGSNFLRRERGLFSATVIGRLDKKGKLSLITTSVPDNYALLKMWRQSAAEILGIEENMVDISSDEEGQIALAGPATLSRNITVTTRLVNQACEQIKKRRFRDPLPLVVKKTYQNSSTRKWDTETFSGHPFQELSWGGCVVEAEIDEMTFSPVVKRVWYAIDCGTVLNRNSALAEVESETMQALGWCFTEDPEKKRYWKLPGIENLPEIHVDFIESSSRTANALGGMVFNTFPAAYRNAVSAAARSQFASIPIRPEDIYTALEGR